MRTLTIGIAGLGSVGRATFDLLISKRAYYRQKYQLDIVIGALANRSVKKDLILGDIPFHTDIMQLVQDDSIDIVIELIGDTTDALKLVSTAIEKRKHVITANKALIATHGELLLAQAQKHGVMLSFEGAVGGGIPIINAIENGLQANELQGLVAIINGTSNYILSSMTKKQCSFSEALQEAQELGYAEANPSFDIQGTDALHKLAILAKIGFGIPINTENIYQQGIEHIQIDDINYANELGFVIKHIAIARKSIIDDQEVMELRVHPALISHQHILANVHSVMNAVNVIADTAGQMLFYGAGAGGNATASAVVADLLHYARWGNGDQHSFKPTYRSSTAIINIGQVYSEYYLRIHALDQPSVLKQITSSFSQLDINVQSIMQHQKNIVRQGDKKMIAIVIVSGLTQENNIQRLLVELRNMSEVQSEIMCLHIMDSN